jgi:hypothetical protein
MCAAAVAPDIERRPPEPVGIGGTVRALPPADLCHFSLLPDRRNGVSRARLRDRIHSEYREMPGMQLTLSQGARLFALDCATCQRVFGECLSEGWLRCTQAGRYALISAEP